MEGIKDTKGTEVKKTKKGTKAPKKKAQPVSTYKRKRDSVEVLSIPSKDDEEARLLERKKASLNLKKGETVLIKDEITHYVNGDKIPEEVKHQIHYVTDTPSLRLVPISILSSGRPSGYLYEADLMRV